MAIPVYAAPSDLTPDWLAAVPPNAVPLIRAASILVRDKTQIAEYEVDEDTDLPTDTKVVETFRDATLAQAAMWSRSGIDPDAGVSGQAQQIAAQSVPGGSVTYQAGLTPEQLDEAINCLCRRSFLILRNAGLISHAPRLY